MDLYFVIKQMLHVHSEVVQWPEHQLLCDLGLIEYTAPPPPNPPAVQETIPEEVDEQELHLGTPV